MLIFNFYKLKLFQNIKIKVLISALEIKIDMEIIVILSLILIPWIGYLLKLKQTDSLAIEFFYYLLFTFLFIQHIVTFSFYTGQYYESINLIDIDFSPISYHHLPTYIVYKLLFFISIALIWLKGRKIPPLRR